jgi:hypothetical protein
MKNITILAFFAFSGFTAQAQSCNFDQQITTADSVMCVGDTVSLSFLLPSPLVDTILPTPIVNNNGQDGNMFDITATNTIRIRYFEGNIANVPNVTTSYSIYYKQGTHVGFENNAAVWTLIADSIAFNPNTPNTLSVIPYNLNLVIPAGATYAFYLTNTSAVGNNNRYSNGTATGDISATNADLTVFQGTGGGYPFGTFFNARPWEGIVHYDSPAASYLWNTGDTTPSIEVSPVSTMDYSCEITIPGLTCTVEDTITVQVNNLPVLNFPDVTSLCIGDSALLDAGNPGSAYFWSTTETSQTIFSSVNGEITLTVTDMNGCVSTDSTMVTVNALPLVTLSPIPDVCFNEVVTLTQGNPIGGVYSGTDITGGIFDPSNAGVHIVVYEFTDTNGCVSSDTNTILANPLPTVEFSALGDLCVYNNAIILTQGIPTGGSYSGAGVSGGNFNPSLAGTGTHVLTYEFTDVNGCQNSDTSQVFVDACLSVEEVSMNVLTIYPNPFQNSTTITLNQSVELNQTHFEVYDMTGKRVLVLTPIDYTFELVRGNLQSGMYHYGVISNGKSLKTGKLILE